MNFRRTLNPYLALLLITLIASGVAYWLAWQSNRVESENPLPITVRRHASRTTGDSIDTSTWKTYRNEKYGFEMKYPVGYKIEEDSTGYLVLKPLDTEFDLTISLIRTREPLETAGVFVHNNTGYDTDYKFGYTDESVATINGIIVYRFKQILAREDDWHFFFLKDADHGVDASWTNSHVDYGENPFGHEFETILSTFKFTK